LDLRALSLGRPATTAVALGVLYAGLAKLVDLEASLGDPERAVVFWPAAGVSEALVL